MDYNEAYSFALKQTLNQMQNICPNITNSFIYSKDGQIQIGDQNTNKDTIMQVMDIFKEMLEKEEALGNVESIILKGAKGGVNLFQMNNLYLVSVTSGKTDSNYINTLNRVLVPTVLALLEKINPESLKNNQSLQPKDEEGGKKEEKSIANKGKEDLEDKVIKPLQPKTIKIQPESPVNQLRIATLKGIFVSSDTVRIDSKILSEWMKRFHGKVEVEVEASNGKRIRCKVEEIRSKKNIGKGIILVPVKIQKNLDIKNGELVKVRPIQKRDMNKDEYDLEMASITVGRLESYPIFL